MGKRKRLLIASGAVALLAGGWAYQRARLTEEERWYVGTWDGGNLIELHPDHTLVCRYTDPETQEPRVSVRRWSVRGGRLHDDAPHGLLPFVADPVASRAYTVISKEPGRLVLQNDLSGGDFTLLRRADARSGQPRPRFS